VRLAALLFLTLCLDGITEPAPRMGHATNMRQIVRCNDRVVAIITIRLQIALEVIQQALGHLGTATRIIVIQDDRLVWRPTPLQSQIGLRLCRFTEFLEHLHRGLVHLQDVIGQQAVAQQIDQRPLAVIHGPCTKAIFCCVFCNALSRGLAGPDVFKPIALVFRQCNPFCFIHPLAPL